MTVSRGIAGDAKAEGSTNSRGSAQEGTKSLLRGLAVVRYLSSVESIGGVSLTDLAKNLGLNKSTAYRLLDALRREGFVRQDVDTDRYRLGYMVLSIAAQLLNNSDIRGTASAELRDLASEIGYSTHLVAWDSGRILYLDKVQMGDWSRASTNIGMRNPAHCTASGKAMLAYLPENAVEEAVARGLERRTQNSITNEPGLRKALQEVRIRGYAVDDREINEHSRAVAAPVFDYRGRVVAAISAAGMAADLTVEKIEEVAPKVVKAAYAISRRLGYQT